MSLPVLTRSLAALLGASLLTVRAQAAESAPATEETAPESPTGAPPPLVETAPGFDQGDDADDDGQPSEGTSDKSNAPKLDAGVGAHWLWAQGKAMPGITLRAGKGYFWGAFETSLIWLTESDPKYGFVGSQFGGYFMVSPLHTSRVNLQAGVGVDAYPLWNINGDEWQVALSLRASGHFRVAPRLGIFGTARYYPVSTSGLELGTERDGSTGFPILLGTGVEWWF